MKKKNSTKIFMFLMLCLSFTAFGQLNTPRGSQMATVTQRVGITDISITYSRPSVRDREIWGGLVPYGMNNLGFGTATESPWRAGANENTTITFESDVKVEGKSLNAGTYGLHLIIYEDEKATVVFSNNSTSWGSFFYEASEDALRVDVTTYSIPHTELLTFDFKDVDATSTTAVLNWEKKQIPFKIEVDVTNIVMADIKNKLKSQLGFNRQTWENAARFALNNGGDLEVALVWVNNTIEGQFYSQKTFNNLALKGQILNKQGKKEAYAKLMDEASAMANMNQLNNLGYQMLGAKDYDLALKYFKQNVANNPENANVHDSLGEGYKTIGDNKNAIKSFKKSLSLNPPANVKANSEKLLKELGVL